jgi:hypothetical protein
MKWRTGVLSVLGFVGLCLAGVSRSSKAEETPTGYYKWVDANNDCRSTCDSTKYKCPCYRL